MTTLQQFCLRWNNHQPNFISVFTNLLSNEALVDVTLAAEGRHLQAHKVVLSACSSYFQTLFTINPCQHPIVILKDVKFDDLKTMVDFMYYGEVNVSQEQLPAILKTAEMLKVKGLAEMPESSTTSSSGLHVTKTENVSFEKAEILTSTDSTWGLDIRRSPSPMSPSIRRKRLRKSSTGSGSGSTERTSDELPSEITILPMQSSIKSEVVPTIQGRESARSDNSLRTSIQEPSTDSEPREGSQESIDEDPLSLQASQDNSTGSMEHMVKDSSPGPSTSQLATTPQAYKPGKRSRGPLTRQPRVKKESDQPHTSPDTEPSSPHFTSQPPVRIETQSPPAALPSSPPNPFPPVPSHNLLSVPQTTYLVKQHSHPLLPSQKTVHSPASTSLIVQRQHSTPTPSSGSYSNPTALVVDTHPRALSPSADVPVLRVISDPPETRPRVRLEEFRRTASTPQVSTTTRDSFEPRSVHCPMLRPGPALGCNFCWNTIDGHGRILRRKTKYHCPECQTNLCIVPCFQEYHEKHTAGLSSSSRDSMGRTSPTTVKPALPKTSSI